MLFSISNAAISIFFTTGVQTMHKKLIFALSALLFAISSANATSIETVNIDFGWGTTSDGTIQFTGNVENNGTINFGDLTSFTLSDRFGDSSNLSNLVAFGTFDTNTNLWNNNAQAWNGFPWLAYATWDNYFLSFNTIDGGAYVITSETTPNVPEPASLSLAGLGLLALAAVRRKAKQQ